MPKFTNKSSSTGKKRNPQIGVIVTENLKRKLEIIAEYHKRTVSDFCKIELEKITEKEEYRDILNNNE